MQQVNLTLAISMDWWREYQGLLEKAIMPLSADHLALRLGTQRSVGELIAHMVSVRAWYLCGVMGEGGADIAALIGWDKPDAPCRSSAELLAGFDQTWQLMTACIGRWTAGDLNAMFFLDWRGRDESRGWILWHVLEHEIHHGGELSFTLGSFGLAGVDV